MFEKSKVKGYSKLSKSKSGFKVIRVKEFLRKRDEKDHTVRNAVLGVTAISALGIGTALLLKKKGGINFPGQLAEKNLLTNKVVDVQSSVVKEFDNVVTPKTQLSTKSNFPQVEDPWASPITKPSSRGSKLLVQRNIKDRSIKRSTEKIVQETENLKLLPSAKSRTALGKPEPRGNLLVPKSTNKVEESLVNMRNTQKNYDNLPLPMKVTLQMEKALTRPIKNSNLGKQLDTKGLKVILGDSEKLPIEKVISKAKRKVGDRLKRQNEELAKKNLMT